MPPTVPEMVTCFFKLDGKDYKLKAGDKVRIYSDTYNTTLVFYAREVGASGSGLRIEGLGEQRHTSGFFHVNRYGSHDELVLGRGFNPNILCPIITMLTGLKMHLEMNGQMTWYTLEK